MPLAIKKNPKPQKPKQNKLFYDSINKKKNPPYKTNSEFRGIFIKIRKALYSGDQEAKEFLLFSPA